MWDSQVIRFLFCGFKQTDPDVHIQVSLSVKGAALVSCAHVDSFLTKYWEV